MEKTIVLSETKTTIIQPEVSISFNEITLKELIDDGSSVIAYLSINNMYKRYTLWEGAAYTAIGDWTQAQAEARIVELFS